MIFQCTSSSNALWEARKNYWGSRVKRLMRGSLTYRIVTECDQSLSSDLQSPLRGKWSFALSSVRDDEERECRIERANDGKSLKANCKITELSRNWSLRQTSMIKPTFRVLVLRSYNSLFSTLKDFLPETSYTDEIS